MIGIQMNIHTDENTQRIPLSTEGIHRDSLEKQKEFTGFPLRIHRNTEGNRAKYSENRAKIAFFLDEVFWDPKKGVFLIDFGGVKTPLFGMKSGGVPQNRGGSSVPVSLGIMIWSTF